MICVGIDVAKDKHDCIIVNSEGEVLFKPFVILNNRVGFDELYEKICSVGVNFDKIKVGLEATGHYSYNLLGYLLDKGLPTYIINPLHTAIICINPSRFDDLQPLIPASEYTLTNSHSLCSAISRV